MGAWIEIIMHTILFEIKRSHSVRGRGLKKYDDFEGEILNQSHSVRGRGLKFAFQKATISN